MKLTSLLFALTVCVLWISLMSSGNFSFRVTQFLFGSKRSFAVACHQAMPTVFLMFENVRSSLLHDLNSL